MLTVITLKGYECALLSGSKRQRAETKFHLERRVNGKEVVVHSKILLLVQTLFSFLYDTDDPRNRKEFRINLSDFGRFAGICMDKRQRMDFLRDYHELTELYGIEKTESGEQMEPLFSKLELEHDGFTLVVETGYFSKILSEIFAEVNAMRQKRVYAMFYTRFVRSSICGARDPNAALAVLILSILIAQRGTNETTVELSLMELTGRIPELNGQIREPGLSKKSKNRNLGRWFERITGRLGGGNYIEKYTSLLDHYGSFHIFTCFGSDGKKGPSLSCLSNRSNKIMISHDKYRPSGKPALPEQENLDYSANGYIPKNMYGGMTQRQQINSLKYFLKAYLLGLGVEAEEGQRFHCVMPDHEDRNPSMVYYPAGMSPFPRVHCFGCGFDGDLFELIQKTKGVNFAEALSIAEKLFVYDESKRGEK